MLGVGVGLGVVILTRILRRVSKSARDLEEQLGAAIGHPSPGLIFWMALFSSIGEEAFFRGAMQPVLGLTITAIIFGLLHGFFLPKWWFWTVFALAIGFAFGQMFESTGNLLAPIGAHFTINLLNLYAITRPKAEERAP